MKSSGIVKMYHAKSFCYWVRTDSHIVVVSKQKMRILNLIHVRRRVFQLAAKLRRDDRTVARRLFELKRIGLAELQKPFWVRKSTECKVIPI